MYQLTLSVCQHGVSKFPGLQSDRARWHGWKFWSPGNFDIGMAGIEGQRTSLQRYCTKYVQSFDECREYPWGLRQENMSSPSPCRVHSKNSQYQRRLRIELSWRFRSILFHIRYLRRLISGRFIYFRHIKWVVIKASSSLAFYSLGPVAFTNPSSPFALSTYFYIMLFFTTSFFP